MVGGRKKTRAGTRRTRRKISGGAPIVAALMSNFISSASVFAPVGMALGYSQVKRWRGRSRRRRRASK
jgi:hypothetical protein